MENSKRMQMFLKFNYWCLGLVCILFLGYLLLPTLASAHEVYVLDQATINSAMATTSPNTFSAYIGNESLFFFWFFVGCVTVMTVFFATIFRVFEKSLGPVFAHLKRYALFIVRITTGISMLSFGIAGALYGTEIPFASIFGALSPLMSGIFIIGGGAVSLGLFTRPFAALMALIYLYTGFEYGLYILTYTDHIGAYLALLILGGGAWSLDHAFNTHRFLSLDSMRRFSHLAFPLLRILFGFGIMFASIYAKYLHSELAMQVVVQYNLTDYFPFDPLFVVLGALIIEFLAGLMLVLGIGIRWTGLFLLFWLTLSLLYFQEAVWPHIILFGLGTAIFCHGYDRLSLEGALMKKRGNEPIM